MQKDLLLILGLLMIVMLLVMVAQRIRIAYPIFLVIAGLGISFIPGVPEVKLDPEVIFLFFLPPILYEAAWYTSWNDFWKWKRPIAFLALGLVLVTSSVVAYASTVLIPGFTLALGFLLGGIISPPDAIAATTVLKGMKVPRRTSTILEGESLVNDASSLIVFRFALLTIFTGTFSIQAAVGQFFVVAGMGIVVGILLAHLFYVIHRFLPTTPAIDATFTIITPYVLYLTAEHFHFSGVMAVVSGGLFMSFRSHEIFKTGMTRVNMVGVWETLIFTMNALLFIMIGLELPEVIRGLGETSIVQGIQYGLIISLIVIVVRILWVYPLAHVPRWISSAARKDVSPGWKNPLIIGWAGMRGVVSLATALSIPTVVYAQMAFPFRNLIIFITFIVIFITLVFQGLTLPLLIKWIKIDEIDPVSSSHEQQMGIQKILDQVAKDELERNDALQIEQNSFLRNLNQRLNDNLAIEQLHLTATELHDQKQKELNEYHGILADIFKLQRKALVNMRKQKLYSEEEIRKAESSLDLKELKIAGYKHF